MIDEVINQAIKDVMLQEAMCMERAIHIYLSGLSWWQRLFVKRHIKKNLVLEVDQNHVQTLKTRTGKVLLRINPPKITIVG